MADARFCCAALLLATALGGCDDGGGGGSTLPDRGLLDLDSGVGDARPPTVWDSGLDGRVVRADRFVVERDAGVEACLAEGATPVERATGEAIAGARSLRADLDVDGDDLADLAVRIEDAEGVHFLLVDGETLVPGARLTLRGAVDGELMPNLWPARSGLLRPIPVGEGQVGFVALERRPDNVVGLRVLTAGGEGLRFIEFSEGLSRLTLMDTRQGWRALVDTPQGGCALYSVEAEAPLGAWPACTLRPGWDVNADDGVDVVRTSTTGVAVIDGRTGEPAIQRGDAIALGVAPPVPAEGSLPAGPVDLRGAGPEVIGVLQERGLRLTYREPLELAPAELEPQIVAGNHARFDFLQGPSGLRLWAEDDRGGLKVLQVYELGNTLRPRGEVGPFRYLQWGPGPDVDNDGFPEVWVLGGSSEQGDNTPVQFLSVNDGSSVFTLPAERNARYDVAWAGGIHGYDLDGCPGEEHVAIRRGNGREGGPTPTRLVIADARGEAIWRAEGVDSYAHSAAVADVDGDGQPELLELLGKTAEGAAITVWTVGAAE
ncbi:MAG: hypothetical protein KC613_01205 [Myxococcales bacterium]|nr:hypothetical protein [Myxococcales bacterium]MCB9522307.1 hypothetical protein [Myxococcales bacterium]